jgi:adenylate cyclase
MTSVEATIQENIDRAFADDRATSARRSGLIRFCGLSLILILGAYMAFGVRSPEWRVNFHILCLHWIITLTLCFLVWRAESAIRWAGVAFAFADMGMVYWLQSSAIPVSASPGGVAGFTIGLFCLMILLASLYLDLPAIILVTACGLILEIMLQRQANIGPGAQVASFVVLGMTTLSASYLFSRIRTLIKAVTQEELRLAKLGRYFSPNIASKLQETQTDGMSPEACEVTLLFSEIQNFDELTAALPPQDIVAALNEYYGLMVEAIFKYGGTLDKFLSDGLMAYFGAPVADPDHARSAVRCALEMTRVSDAMNARRRARGAREIRLGIGVHTGQVVIGDIGAPTRRLEYTAIGDAVNLTARIKSLAKFQNAMLLVSQSTRERVGGDFSWIELPAMSVKGKSQPVITCIPILPLEFSGEETS